VSALRRLGFPISARTQHDARVGEQIARYGAETEDIVKFTIGQQSRIGGNNGAAKPQHRPVVEIEPENAIG